MSKSNHSFTRIPNELLEALGKIRIPGEARRIFDVILRKTLRFNKNSDIISLSQFEEITGIKKTHVARLIYKLENLNMITVDRKGYTMSFAIQRDHNKWNSLPIRRNFKSFAI